MVGSSARGRKRGGYFEFQGRNINVGVSLSSHNRLLIPGLPWSNWYRVYVGRLSVVVVIIQEC